MVFHKTNKKNSFAFEAVVVHKDKKKKKKDKNLILLFCYRKLVQLCVPWNKGRHKTST